MNNTRFVEGYDGYSYPCMRMRRQTFGLQGGYSDFLNGLLMYGLGGISDLCGSLEIMRSPRENLMDMHF